MHHTRNNDNSPIYESKDISDSNYSQEIVLSFTLTDFFLSFFFHAIELPIYRFINHGKTRFSDL